MEKKINIAVVNLLGHLVSANSIFLIPTLQMIMKSLKELPVSVVQLGIVAQSINTSTMQPWSELTAMLHDTLRYAMSAVPTGLVELIPGDKQSFK